MAQLGHLLPPSAKTLIASWLFEDTPTFDFGGLVVGDKEDVGTIYGKSDGVLAGRPFVDEIFSQCGCKVEWCLDEGDAFERIAIVARVTGPARMILIGERVALNTLARASGIATRARRLHNIKVAQSWPGVIAGTRKTTPGFRLVEKYAMLVGGVDTHRMDLSSMVMLKDNHIWASGSITSAVQKMKPVSGFSLKIEVEVRNKDEAIEAIEAGADIIMLDNFSTVDMKRVAKELKDAYKGQKWFLIEGSGGMTEENCSEFMSPDVDILSFGSLSQSVPHVDFSLKVNPPEAYGQNAK